MKKRIILALLFSSLFVFSILFTSHFSDNVEGQTSATDWWPMYQHDPTHSGSSSSIVPKTNETLWTFDIDRLYSSGTAPSVVDERIFIGSGGTFQCINSSTGVLLWSYNKPYLDPSTSPAVSNNKVVISGGRNELFCFNVENGNMLWNFTAENWLRSSPIINEEKVYVGSEDGTCYCLDLITGFLIRKYQTVQSISTSPTIVEDKLYLRSESGTLQCIDTTTGNQVWTYVLGSGEGYSSPVFYERKIIVGTGHGNNTLYCLNSDSGELIWKYETEGWISATPAVTDGKVFIGDWGNTARVYCINIIDGSLVWKKSYEGEYGAEYSSPVVADGKIIICIGKNLYVLNQVDGEIIWKYVPEIRHYGSSESRGFTDQSIALAEGRIYVASDEFLLFCFGPMIYYDIVVEPQYLNNKGNLFNPLPSFCTFEFSNETEINSSTPISFRAPLGAFSINNVTWNGYGVLTTQNKFSIYLDSDMLVIPKINCTLPSITSLFLSSSTSSVGFNINVNGRLTCNDEGVSSAPILITYSVTDGQTWNELTQAITDQNGEYSAVWMPTVSGRYIVKAVWDGNYTFPKSSIQTYLSVLPVLEQNVISVASNSKISNLIFTSSTKEISFNILDSSESLGYSDVFIPKDIVGNVEAEVLCDGKMVENDISSIENSWLLHFNYIGDVNEVTISLSETSIPFGLPETDLLPMLLVLSIIVLCAVYVLYVFFSRRKRKLNLET